MSLNNHWLSIQSFKHNGSLHRFWDRGFVVENNDDFIVVVSKRAKVIESNGRRWFTKEPAVTIFSKKEWWNAICMIKKDGICYYCNIASPALADKNCIRYIDYDLDAKLLQNKEIKILDEVEYKHHKDYYKYGDDLDTVLRYTTKLLIERMKKEEFPFQDNLVRDYFMMFEEKNKKE